MAQHLNPAAAMPAIPIAEKSTDQPPWQQTLAAIWAAQFLTLCGFSFAVPFIPYFMQQDLGVDPAHLNRYVALFAALAPLSLAICTPVWGMLADRYGRRMMLIRATLGAAVMLGGMGLSRSIGVLLIFRALQGVLTGTMNAAQAIVATRTPSERTGFAMGLLSTAVFCGTMVGSVVGGSFADAFGYRAAFGVSAGLNVVAALVVILFTRERPSRPRRRKGEAAPATPPIPRALWLLISMGTLLAIVRHIDQPFLPLLVQELHGGIEGAARRSGLLFGAGGVAGLLAGIVIGRVSDRIAVNRATVVCLAMGALFMLPHAWAQSIGVLVGLRFGLAFFMLGLDVLFNALLARTAPRGCHAAVFGWAASARSVGWLLAPLLGGLLVDHWHIRSLFVASALMMVLLIPLSKRIFARAENKFLP